MNETILIVDDTPTNLQVLVGFLAHGGYHIHVAEDGPSALEQLACARPDIILLDVAMPGMDGFELCRKIKANDQTRDIPVLFLTARSEVSDKLKGFQAGGVDYITKPIQKEEVIARVNTHLTILQQQRQLQRLLDQRQRFMRIAAHDLRNLVAIISGFAEVGYNSPGLEDKQRCLRRVSDASKRTRVLIDEFLALQGRQSGAQAEPFDLKDVIQQILEESALAASSKDIALSAQLPAEPALVQGHLGYTHQILTNYLSNALKYSPRGTQTRVAVRSLGGHWRAEVSDQGPGILPAEREKLFIEFPKISNRPTGGEISTGLGLSIVKTLAEAQGGRVGAEFPEGGGSLFWLDVPATPPPVPGVPIIALGAREVPESLQPANV